MLEGFQWMCAAYLVGMLSILVGSFDRFSTTIDRFSGGALYNSDRLSIDVRYVFDKLFQDARSISDRFSIDCSVDASYMLYTTTMDVR